MAPHYAKARVFTKGKSHRTEAMALVVSPQIIGFKVWLKAAACLAAAGHSRHAAGYSAAAENFPVDRVVRAGQRPVPGFSNAQSVPAIMVVSPCSAPLH